MYVLPSTDQVYESHSIIVAVLDVLLLIVRIKVLVSGHPKLLVLIFI